MIKLSSGKEFYANHGIIGIAPRDDKYFTLTEGYDGTIEIKDFEDNKVFTNTELIEIADLMIDRWLSFKIRVKRGEFE